MSVSQVRERMRAAALRAGRNPDEVTLIAVTKGHSASEINDAVYTHGIKRFGENRVQEWRDKQPLLPAEVEWHFIGNLQRNKVKYLAAGGLTWIHSVNSTRLIQTLNTQGENHAVTFNVMLEVNVANDPNKHGADANELPALLEAAHTAAHVNVRGLMTMAPFQPDPEASRPTFRALQELADRHGLEHRSMGMSNDFEVAIEEGSTMVRVGSALFDHLSSPPPSGRVAEGAS